MSVIIRLQNLPWSANALDIRQFFQGLSIPEGGVHIVGGELGDAFIAFSTDEDARQAFNHNGGKIKEIQVKLMLSSRTEMQKVIEAARNPLAAFMQTTTPQVPTALPTIIPSAVPLAIPETKKDELKDKTDKRDKRRSRSRSRDRKERSRDRDRRDRRRRDRSRSRSRDRKDRRRRDRSRSRDRTRSKERDRRSKDHRRSEDKTGSSASSSTSNLQKEQSKVGVWESPISNDSLSVPQQANIISNFIPNNLEEARRNLNALHQPSLLGDSNGFRNQRNNFGNNRVRDSWPPSGPLHQDSDGRMDFQNRNERNFQNSLNEDRFKGGQPRHGPGSHFGGNQSSNDGGRAGFNRPHLLRQDGSLSRFGPERPALLDHPQSDQARNCCVQLRPFYGGYGEIRRFFQGIFINNTGIKFVNDEYGKRTGVVFIRFAFPEGRDQALKRSGGFLKNMKVEVTPLDDDQFDKTVDRFHPSLVEPDDSSDQAQKSRNITKYFNNRSQHSPQSTMKLFSCLIVEDLPSFAKEQDILKMFSDYPLVCILMVNKPRHHVAYVKFSKPDDAKTAQGEKAKHVIDGKPVTVKPCSDKEFESVNSEQNEPELIKNDDDDEDDDEDKDFPIDSVYISLSGLPLKTTDRDITDFFSDIAVVPEKINLCNSHLGFTGQAFCEFATISVAELALEKDGMPLGSGIISVKSISKEEMDSIIGITHPPNIHSHMNHSSNPGRPFFPRNNFGPGHGPRGPGLMGPRPPMRRFLPPQHNTGDVGPPGCVVLMENVPYKAGLNEILEFFDGFDVPPDNVLRRYNENGTPSGEAKVIFGNPNDAYQAVEAKRFHKIRERTIYLTQI